MLTQLCGYLRNWFETDRYTGNFVIRGGELAGPGLPLLHGQYYRLVGSVFNDGAHKWGDRADVLRDEPGFTGAVWPMAVPREVEALAGEIAEWTEENRAAISSPYQSESFDGYSYSLKSGGSAVDGQNGTTWQGHFAARLAPWRKL